MKRAVILLLAIAAAAQLCGCTGSIGDVVQKIRKEETPVEQAETAEEEAPETEPEETAEEPIKETVEEPEEAELTEAEKTVQTYFDQREVWEDGESLDIATSGVYGTGYAFFDIDLDGTKELAVQYGGGTMHNCVTRFFRLNADNTVVPYTAPDSLFSLSVLDLKLAKSADTTFYLMEYTLKGYPAEYWTYYAEIRYDAEKIEFSEAAVFACSTVYDADGNENDTYLVGNDEVTEDEYNAAFAEYMSGLTVTETGVIFVPYFDWKDADTDTRYTMLLNSLDA